jgi:fructoselysine 6-kinase
MYPGGNAVNVAVLAARYGARSAYLGRVGNDAAGQLVLDSLRAEGVSTARVQVYDGMNAYANIELRNTDRVFVGASKEDSLFTLSADDLDYAAGFDLVHTAYSADLVGDIPALAKRARVSYDYGNRFTEPNEELLRHLFLGTVSGGGRTAAEGEQLARALVEAGATYGLVTLGSDGAVLAKGSQVWCAGPEPVAAVDTLGAGDSFVATLLVGLLSGDDEQGTLSRAATHAALVCTYHGAFGHEAALPSEPIDSELIILGEN